MYPVKPSGISFTVDPELAEIRPVLGSAVIRGVEFDDESIQSIMSLQESLHWAVGRGRSKVAIGIHDLETVRPPFHYIASPGTRTFIPLDFTGDDHGGDPREAPEREGLCEDRQGFPAFPLITDEEDRSFRSPR